MDRSRRRAESNVRFARLSRGGQQATPAAEMYATPVYTTKPGPHREPMGAALSGVDHLDTRVEVRPWCVGHPSAEATSRTEHVLGLNRRTRDIRSRSDADFGGTQLRRGLRGPWQATHFASVVRRSSTRITSRKVG